MYTDLKFSEYVYSDELSQISCNSKIWNQITDCKIKN